jgi:hypothetical protein
LTPVKIDYQVLTLKEFAARFPASWRRRARCVCISRPSRPDHVERRNLDETANVSRSGIWQIANPSCATCCRPSAPRWAASLRRPGCAAMMATGVHRALGRDGHGARRGDVCARVDARLPQEAWKARSTYTAVGVSPRPNFRKCSRSTSRSARRTTSSIAIVAMSSAAPPPASGSRLSVQRQLLGTHVYPGALIHRRKRLGRLSHRLQRFRVRLGGVPTFNQTRALQPEHITRAFGERAKLFRALRQRTDPLNRLRNSYFAYLLG